MKYATWAIGTAVVLCQSIFKTKAQIDINACVDCLTFGPPVTRSCNNLIPFFEDLAACTEICGFSEDTFNCKSVDITINGVPCDDYLELAACKKVFGVIFDELEEGKSATVIEWSVDDGAGTEVVFRFNDGQ